MQVRPSPPAPGPATSAWCAAIVADQSAEALHGSLMCTAAEYCVLSESCRQGYFEKYKQPGANVHAFLRLHSTQGERACKCKSRQ